MDLRINIETLEDKSVTIPIKDGDGLLQVRHDGVYIDGNLHFWEQIISINIINRGLLKELKRKEK